MRSVLALLLVVPALALAGCSSDVCCAIPDASPDVRAIALTQDALLVDTYIDASDRLLRRPADLAQRAAAGDFDYPRAVAGGLDVAFLSISIPTRDQATGRAGALADSLIDAIEALAEAHPDTFAVVRSAGDVKRLRQRGRVLLALRMEGGAPIETLGDVRRYRDRGIRYVTLTHGHDNRLADSSQGAGTHGGLSDFGRDVVREMNRRGVMVDVSHLSDAAFDDVMEVTDAPVIASHSSARHVTPDFEGNLDDDRIRQLAQNGGVLQVNFGSALLRQRFRDDRDALRSALDDSLAARGIEPQSGEADGYADAFYARNPLRPAEVTDVADHIDHVRDLVGVDHIGIGSGYGGAGATLPRGLEDVSTYPNLVAELLRRGYPEEDIRKILGENTMRVWRAVEARAED